MKRERISSVVKKYLREFEERVAELEDELKNIDNEAWINLLTKKIRKSLLEGRLDWMKEEDRKILLDVWDAFRAGLVDKEVLERAIKMVARKMLVGE